MEEPAPRMFWPREIWGRYGRQLSDFKETSPLERKAAVQCLNHMVGPWASRAVQGSAAPVMVVYSAVLKGPGREGVQGFWEETWRGWSIGGHACVEVLRGQWSGWWAMAWSGIRHGHEGRAAAMADGAACRPLQPLPPPLATWPPP